MIARLSSAPIWVRAAMSVAVAILILLLVLRLFAMTPMARGMVESRLEAMTIRGQTVEVDGLKGDVLGRMTVDRLTVRDASGVWVEASDAELEWSPLSALFGHLKIKRVIIDEIAVSRRSELAPASSRPQTSSSFFKRYEIANLGVANLAISEGVAGPLQSYILEAQLDARPQRGTVSLKVLPVDHRGDEVLADLEWGGAVPLRGHVTLSGEPSGLVATLLQVADGQTVSAELDASGSLDRWQLTANGAVGGISVLKLEGEMRDQVRSLSGRVALDTLGALQPLQRRLGNEIVFASKLDELGRLSVQAEADNAMFDLAGTLADGPLIEDLRLDLSDLNMIELTGQSELELSSLNATGVLDLAPNARRFDGRIFSPSVRFGAYSATEVSSTGQHEYREGALLIDHVLTVSALSGLPDAISDLIAGPLDVSSAATVHFKDRTAEISSLTFSAARVQGEATGEISMPGPVDLSGDLRLRGIAPVRQFDGDWTYRGDSPGTATLRLTGMAALDTARSELAQILGNFAQIDLTVQQERGGVILESGSIRSGDVQLRAAGAMRDGALDFDGRFTSPSLTLDAARIESLDVTVKLSGTVAAPIADLSLESEQLVLFGQELEVATLEGRISLDDGWGFDLASSATLMDAALNTSASGKYRDGVIQLREMRADWDELTAVGDGELVVAAPARSEFSLDLQGTAPIVGDVTGLATYSNEVLGAEVAVRSFALGPMDVSEGKAQLSGAWPRFEGTLEYGGDVLFLSEDTPVSGRHGLKLDLEQRNLLVDGSALIAGQELSVTTPVNLEFGAQPRVSGILRAFDGDISFEIQPDGAAVSDVSLTDISMAKVGPLILRPSLRGVLNGWVELSLLDDQVNGGARGTVSGLARGGPDAPVAELNLEAEIVGNELVGHVRAEDADQSLDLLASLSASLTHEGTLFSIRPMVGAPVPASLKGGGPIAPIWALVAPPDLRLEGDLSVDINNGTGEPFRFEGPLAFENGVFEDGFSGLHLNTMTVDAVLVPSGISVQQASASGIRGGRAEASGVYDFDGDGSVALQLNRLRAFNRADVDATVSGSANIDRRNRRTHIKGNLTLDEARANLSSLPGAGYTTMDVVFTDQLNGDELEAPVREAISLELGVSASRRVFVIGPSLDTEWGVNARITGSPGRPSVIGRATLVRGEADLLGRRFRLSEGLVRFVGDPTDTQIAISAERASSDISAWVDVSGSITDPAISLRADPPLPDDEILARVLFGRSPGELSPLQAAQLAGAAAQLAGGEAFNLLNELEASIGLDRLDFGFDDSGAAILSTGKYLADDVYLELQSGGTGAPGVALEWTPLQNVEIDAEVDPELGPKVSVQWKRDFDDRPAEPETE
ncbi:MAG: translocation/assembly module TamB domain-containing protein [Henriciella sp.]|nr:translocation/assembly module TamB domain-containing protein [Henriciella sp.]MBO6694923.1 translocation/assembly module TamB domain-containing protein [Henriciella sp.]